MKLFKKKEKSEIQSKPVISDYDKRQKRRVLIVGLGWFVIASSIGFGVYNNFTATDTHTVHEKQVIQKELEDTSGIESYVKSFVSTYFTVSDDVSKQQAYTESLQQYLMKNERTSDDLTKDLEGNVSVNSIKIWQIKSTNEKYVYSVLFEVDLQVNKKIVTRAYSLEVYQKNNQYLITKLPIVSAMPQKAIYESQTELKNTLVKAKDKKMCKAF